MDNIENFGPNLRRLIKTKGYKTYQKAADEFDISLSYLNQLMRSEREPSLEQLLVIAEKLEVSASDLLGDGEARSNSANLRAELISSLIAIIPTLNESQLGDLLAIAKGELVDEPVIEPVVNADKLKKSF